MKQALIFMLINVMMIVTDHHFWSLNLQPLVISSTFTIFICSHDDLVPVVFCEIHYHLFVLQKTFQQRIQQREKDLQQLREAVESHKVSLEKKRSLSWSQFRLTEA